MNQQDYNNWSLNETVEHINRGNAPTLNDKEKELIEKVSPKKVLDIGCGNGIRLFSYLSQRNIVFQGVEKFGRLVQDSPYSDYIIVADILNLNETQFNNIDTITILGGSLNGIFGFENHLKAWSKIVNILPLNGKIIFDFVKIDGFKTEQEIGARTLVPGVTPPQFFLAEKQLLTIFKKLNIAIVEQSDVTIPAPYELRYYLLEKTK